MRKFERTIVQISIEDVIRILEDSPARNHSLLRHITIAEVMNRVSIAHLSIEKAIKFLIREAGGKIIEKHHLGNRFRDLKVHDAESAAFLEDAFEAAKNHYGLNDRAEGMTHFRSLDVYLVTTGSDYVFDEIRYWELAPSTSEIFLRQVHIFIHMELLYGLHEILIEPDRPKETVKDRVERAVETALFPSGVVSYAQIKGNKPSLNSPAEWLQQFDTCCEALADAVQRNFALESELAAEVTRAAYKSLLEAKDPAARHFASTLDVLPRQSRDIKPELEWLESHGQRWAQVTTPAGDTLGFAELGPHRLWYITPIRSGLLGVSAKAQSLTDAKCYLGQLLTRSAKVTVDGKTSTLRVVGEEDHAFRPGQTQSDDLEQDLDGPKLYTASFWDENHGIATGQEIRIEAQRNAPGDLIFSDALSGCVQEVRGHQVSVLGRSSTVIGRP